jgi:hypothetical protein
LANSDRNAQYDRVNSAAGQIADEALAPKRGLIDAGIVDKSTWTAEQQAVVDQSLTADRNKLVTDPRIRTQAAINTGDIGPKDAALLTQKDDAQIYKQLWEQTKEENRDRREADREDRKDARQEKQLAAMFARLDRSDSKGDAKANTLQSTQVDGNGYVVGIYRDGTTKRLTDPDGKPVTSQSFEQRVDRTANALVKDGEAKYRKMPPEELRAHVRRTLMSQDTAPAATPPAAPAAIPPKPGASAPKGLPAGARQIGTSGGKPVYELPDGKRIIGQ